MPAARWDRCRPAASSAIPTWTGRWWSLWGCFDLVPMGEKVMVATPGLFDPFMDASEITLGGLIAVIVSLLGVTAGTLYTRVFCPRVDLRSSALLQFIFTGITLAPLALFH